MSDLNFEVHPLDHVLGPIQPAEGENYVDAIYNAIRSKIIDLSLPPHMPLSEKDLAVVFEASKTPVTFSDWHGRSYDVYITKTSRSHLKPRAESNPPEEIWMGVDMIIVLQGGKWDEVFWDAFNYS